jgi:hypothetical protein
MISKRKVRKVTCMREMRNVRKILDGNSEWKRPFGTSRNK